MIKDLESALALWDALDDEAEVFVPIVLNNEGGKNYFFYEKDATPSVKGKMFIRVFINRDEANSYKLSTRYSKLTLATTTLGNLMRSLEKNLASQGDNKVDCVLSTLDMEGKFHIIETLWSNTNKNS